VRPEGQAGHGSNIKRKKYFNSFLFIILGNIHYHTFAHSAKKKQNIKRNIDKKMRTAIITFHMNSAILLLSCRDQKGIVAKISDFIYRHKGNIEHADQHIDGKTLSCASNGHWIISLSTIKISRRF